MKEGFAWQVGEETPMPHLLILAAIAIFRMLEHFSILSTVHHLVLERLYRFK